MLKLFSSLTIAALLIPAAASAATAQEIAAQIEALLKQVSALQTQINAGPTPAGGQTVVPGAGTLQCASIGRALKRGSSGADVTQLQQFLALDPAVYPEAQVTGFYGALTEAAVKKFQCKHGIICTGTPDSTGYGNVGPRTMAAIATQCPQIMGVGANADTVSGFMRVTPTAGAVPLNVKVDVILNSAKSCKAQTYEVFFGDAAAPINITVPAGMCNEMTQTLNHTYTTGGVYTLSLRSGVFQDTVKITATGSSTGTTPTPGPKAFNASPTSGPVPLNVTFTGIRNINNLCNNGSYTLDFGDGQTTTFADSGCSSATFSVSHGYPNVGNYVAKFYRSNVPSDASTISIAVGGSSSDGGIFTATLGTDGDVKKVTAQFDLSSPCARYDINWGDGTANSSQSQGSCAQVNTSKSVTHTYQNAGAYTITLKRGTNLEMTATIGISLVQ